MITLIEVAILVWYVDKKGYTNVNISYEALSDITVLKRFSFGITFVIWLVYAIYYAFTFLVLYFYLIKIVIKEETQNNSIFMFISGYNLPFSFSYALLLLLCCGVDKLGSYVGQTYDDNGIIVDYTNSFFVGICFEFFLEILFYSGTAILLFLYRKKLGNYLVWIAVGCFFGPLIIEFLGLATTLNFFYTYLKDISFLCAIGFGCFFYWKLGSQSAEVGDSYTGAA